MLNSPGSVATLAALSGICTHVFLYRHGEWDVKAPLILVSCIVASVALLAVEKLGAFHAQGLSTGSGWASNCILYHVLGVYASMLLYRAAFHRLKLFPGPFWAKFSNLYVTALSAKKFQLYAEIEKLHSKYGDYVRIGPSELSILDPAAVKVIYSSQAKTSKGPWYNCLEPRVSLQTTRDKADHGRRRRVWDQGFSSNALRDYEPRVSHYAGQLVQAIEKSQGRPIDMAQWSNYYGFDVMGDLAFGKPFEMLQKGVDTYFLTQLHADMKSIGLFSHLMWLFPFFKRIPLLNADYLKFWQWIDDQVKQRIQNPPDRRDVFSWLLGAFEKGPKTPQDCLNLQGDAYLICVAGSDTTSATLTNVLFHLAKYSDLRKELQRQVAGLPNLTNDRLSSLTLLDALINETLRLHPVVPSGIQRMTPSEGIMIGDKYIPGEVLVCIPMHTLFRDERVFALPGEFIPERWTTRPDLIKDFSAWMPFGGGPYVCVGKQLAMMEIRRVVAEILVRYDISFAPNQSESAFLDGKRDAFTLVAAPLELVFHKGH